jgi:hypothetical protein
VGEGAVAPKGVVHVRVDPSVLAIPANAFADRYDLELVELHDAVESFGECAFQICGFTKFRCPPLVTTLPSGTFYFCRQMFSLELPENIIEVEFLAFELCRSLRNVAFAMNTACYRETGHAFQLCGDLLQIFGTAEAIVNAIKIRFVELPIHSKIYYNQMSTEIIQNAIIVGGKLDPTGLHQDCLGMTPLHILACSTVQCLEVYRIMINNYPENLIVADAWGALPLLYAVWGDAPFGDAPFGDAPSEIVQFLVNSYQSLYPDHEFDWSEMVITLGRAEASVAVITNLIHVKQSLSPSYNIDWDRILGVLAVLYSCRAPSKIFCYLTRYSISTRVDAIGIRHFRNAMADDWAGKEHYFIKRQAWRDETLAKLEYYESEYRKLKEMTSLLELALWKARISSLDLGKVIGGGNKKFKVDQSDFRLQCRVSCGADHVVENVWPYLLPPDFVRSQIDDDDDDNDDDNDNVEDDDDSFDNDSDEDEDNDDIED